jgi:hypothetical protein
VTDSRRSEMSEIRITAVLPAGYFGDLYFPPLRLQFGPLLGGHMGSGPPSGAGTLGAAAATYVLTSATIRNNALKARFIGVLSLRVERKGFRVPARARIIQFSVKLSTDYSVLLCPLSSLNGPAGYHPPPFNPFFPI